MSELTSFSNPRFKYLKSLSKSRNRKRESVFIMEGRTELDLARNLGFIPKSVYYAAAYITEKEVGIIAEDAEVIALSKPLFDDLTYQHVPGNYLALFESWSNDLRSINLGRTNVLLEGIEKPGNLGAVLRSCDAAGIRNIIVCDSEIDLFNPNVIRNSRGALFTTNVVFCSNSEALEVIRQQKSKIYAAALSDTSVDYRSIDAESKATIAFGAEATGLSSYWMDNADQHLIIPMSGAVDSLNLSVSVAVVVFHRGI